MDNLKKAYQATNGNGGSFLLSEIFYFVEWQFRVNVIFDLLNMWRSCKQPAETWWLYSLRAFVRRCFHAV